MFDYRRVRASDTARAHRRDVYLCFGVVWNETSVQKSEQSWCFYPLVTICYLKWSSRNSGCFPIKHCDLPWFSMVCKRLPEGIYPFLISDCWWYINYYLRSLSYIKRCSTAEKNNPTTLDALNSLALRLVLSKPSGIQSLGWNGYQVGGWALPLWKIWTSIGMIFPN